MKYIIIANEFTKMFFLNKRNEFSELPQDPRESLEDCVVFSTYKEAMSFCSGKTFTFEGKRVKGFGESYSFNDVCLGIISIRLTKPSVPYFELDDVRKVIELGDDSNLNSLSVTVDGEVILVKRGVGEQIYEYACTNGETFQPNNGYVGVQASLDDDYINSEYMRLLEAWEGHITSYGKFCAGSDYYHPINIDGTKKRITEFIEKNYK